MTFTVMTSFACMGLFLSKLGATSEGKDANLQDIAFGRAPLDLDQIGHSNILICEILFIVWVGG